MKDNEKILNALGDIFKRWQELLASLTVEQITAPQLPSAWSIKMLSLTCGRGSRFPSRGRKRLCATPRPTILPGGRCSVPTRKTGSMRRTRGYMRPTATAPGPMCVRIGRRNSRAISNYCGRFPKRTCPTRHDIRGWEAIPSPRVFKVLSSITKSISTQRSRGLIKTGA